MDASVEIVTPDVGRPFRAFAHGGKCFPTYWHRHADYEFACGMSGELRVSEVVEHVRGPRVVLMGPQLAHSWTEDQPYEHLVIQFRRDWLGAGFLGTIGCERLAALLDRAAAGLVVEGPAAVGITAAVRAMLPLTGLAAIGAMLACLDAFVAAGSREILLATATGAVDPRLQRITEWIDRNASEEIALADAAAVLDMHPQAFARYFRRVSGHSFVGYLGHVRVRNACLLLRDSRRPITEVSLAVGFGTVANFNRTFLRLRKNEP